MRMEDRQHYTDGDFDRADERRQDKEWVAARLNAETTLIYPLSGGKHLVRRDEAGGMAPIIIGRADAEAASDLGEAVLLGVKEEISYFSVTVSDHETLARRHDGDWHDLRAVGSEMNRFDGAMLAYARGIAFWQAGHRFCGACGAPTRSERAGHARRCGNAECGRLNFPRTDPAVITLVIDGERCLLARRRIWPKGRRSTIAGFVEPGESLENTVRREGFEEVGVQIGKVGYRGSQPWPFPASLMMGFWAEATSTEINVDGDEIEEAGWYTPEDIARDTKSGALLLPPVDSISYWLISTWLKERSE